MVEAAALTKSFGPVVALNGFDLTVARGSSSIRARTELLRRWSSRSAVRTPARAYVRTAPGAMVLTVIPCGPASAAT
jgi:hypothetical protein